MYNNGTTYKDASGTYPMVGICRTDSSGNLTQATSDSSLTSGSGVSSVPASNAPSGIGSGDGAAWMIKYTVSNKTLTFSLGGKVTKTMTINMTTMPYLLFALIGSAGDKPTEMTSSIAQVSGTKASMTVSVTYKYTAGNVLKTGATLAVGDGQSVGINNASPIASSDTYSYDAPKITGYNISSANDITVKVGSGTTLSLTLVYAPALQEATVTTSGLVGNSASGGGTTTYKGTTGGTISISDSSLTKAGYTYKVTAPVSNESGVKAAQTALDKVLADTGATALKNSVLADMSDAIKDAWNHLADLQAKASRGEATTADVVATTKALADAIGQNNGIVSGPHTRQAQQKS